MLLRVHPSNFRMRGFTERPELKDLAALARRTGLPLVEDIGSGCLEDLRPYGIPDEPVVHDSLKAGVDLVCFSGDKLLGGPQAGIIVGRASMIERIRKNPINRALRIDKLTLAALETTLRLYRDEERAVAAIPTLRMLTETEASIEARARELAGQLAALGDARITSELVRRPSKAGGGALPLLDLPSCCLRIRIQGMSANALELGLRRNEPPIIARIEDDAAMLDLRTVQPGDLPIIAAALSAVLQTI